MANDVYESRFGLVHYHKRGLGDPVILVHDLYAGASRDEFAHNISALANHFTVYAIDLLGFGDSDAPKMTYTAEMLHHLLRDFIIEVVTQPAHVIASGLSCGLGVRLGVYNEELLNRLVMICPVDRHVPDPPGTMQRLQQFFLGTLNAGASLYETVASQHELGVYLRSRYVNSRHATSEKLERLHYNATRVNSMYPYISLLTGYLDSDTFRWMRYLRSPVMVVWGSALGDAPVEQMFRPAAWSKGQRLEIIENAAHWPHDEQSAKFNDLVKEFFTATSTVAPPSP